MALVFGSCNFRSAADAVLPLQKHWPVAFLKCNVTLSQRNAFFDNNNETDISIWFLSEIGWKQHLYCTPLTSLTCFQSVIVFDKKQRLWVPAPCRVRDLKDWCRIHLFSFSSLLFSRQLKKILYIRDNSQPGLLSFQMLYSGVELTRGGDSGQKKWHTVTVLEMVHKSSFWHDRAALDFCQQTLFHSIFLTAQSCGGCQGRGHSSLIYS